MASVGCVRDDGTAPVVVVQDRFRDLTTLSKSQPISVQEEPEPPEHLTLPGVGDVAFVVERGPVSGSGRELPDDATGAGQVEVDEGRSVPWPPVDDRIERCRGLVIAAQQLSDAG